MTKQTRMRCGHANPRRPQPNFRQDQSPQPPGTTLQVNGGRLLALCVPISADTLIPRHSTDPRMGPKLLTAFCKQHICNETERSPSWQKPPGPGRPAYRDRRDPQASLLTKRQTRPLFPMARTHDSVIRPAACDGLSCILLGFEITLR
jgi:hypothetical protein